MRASAPRGGGPCGRPPAGRNGKGHAPDPGRPLHLLVAVESRVVSGSRREISERYSSSSASFRVSPATFPAEETPPRLRCRPGHIERRIRAVHAGLPARRRVFQSPELLEAPSPPGGPWARHESLQKPFSSIDALRAAKVRPSRSLAREETEPGCERKYKHRVLLRRATALTTFGPS